MAEARAAHRSSKSTQTARWTPTQEVPTKKESGGHKELMSLVVEVGVAANAAGTAAAISVAGTDVGVGNALQWYEQKRG